MKGSTRWIVFATTLAAAVLARPALADIYSFKDEKGIVHYSDRPADSANARELRVGQAQAASQSPADNWRERERLSRENRERLTQAERRQEAAHAAEKANQNPFNPSMNRSNKPMSDDELCTRDQQQNGVHATPCFGIGSAAAGDRAAVRDRPRNCLEPGT